eukprot:11499567-Karenia_brevis.AAC.1
MASRVARIDGGYLHGLRPCASLKRVPHAKWAVIPTPPISGMGDEAEQHQSSTLVGGQVSRHVWDHHNSWFLAHKKNTNVPYM